MSPKPTIKQMFKEIFFDATNGKRTGANFAMGMYIIETIHQFWYRVYFENIYSEWKNGKSSALIMEAIYRNLRSRWYDGKAQAVANAIQDILF